MGQVLLSNNAYTTLAVGCASGDTTLTVASSTTFPAVTTASGNWFYACLQDTFANLEIVKVTNVTGTVWTVTRAIGGTTARAFVSGSVVELRLTAETLNDVTAFTLTSSVQNSTPQYMTSVAGTNTITASLPAPFTAYATGQKFHFIAASTNTGAVTLNINSVGTKAVTKQGAAALVAGDLISGAAYEAIYDGTQFQVVGLPAALGYTPANDANVVHLAGNETVAGVKTFSSAPVFSAGISGLTVTQTNQTPLPGVASLLSYTHGLGITPASAELEIVCLTAEFGFSVGDVVTPYTSGNGSYYNPFSPLKNTTSVSARTGSNVAWAANNQTTGNTTPLTSANWAWRFKVRTS